MPIVRWRCVAQLTTVTELSESWCPKCGAADSAVFECRASVATSRALKAGVKHAIIIDKHVSVKVPLER